MAQTKNIEYRVPHGSTWLYGVRLVNAATGQDFTQATVHSVKELVTDTVLSQVSERTLAAEDVVFDALQTSPLLLGGQYQHNIRVVVPATKIAVRGRRYRYQLVVVPDNGEGSADEDHTHKTDEIDVIGD